jgi:DNA-binding MarR family transcriptional regulator
MRQLQSEVILSRPSEERLEAWRLFWTAATALGDVMETQLRADADLPLRWYDVLIHLEDAPAGLRITDLADQILFSKSGFTRVIDKMEDAGLVRRERPESDRRVVLVHLTDQGRERMEHARSFHRHHIEQLFAKHLSDADVRALARALGKVSNAVRPLRPGRVR